MKNKNNIQEDRFYIGDYELYSKKTNGSLDVKRETLHITDDKAKVALIDTELDTNDLILATTIRYQYTNHLDSASLELDETGDIISYEEYHPFGTTSYRSGRNEIDVSLKRYKYVHKELDNETGLYYYGMRYYAPWIARFISVDPLQFKYPELTPFQYASNCPISYNDLDGAEANKVPDNLKGIMLKRMGVIKQVGPTVENAKQMEEMKMTQTFSEVNQYHLKKTWYYQASINSRYIVFGLRNPVAAIRIGFGVTPGATNISTNATRFATRGEVLYGSKRSQEDRGSENGAFRHSLWQATITSEFGGSVAAQAGNAHEENVFADLSIRSFSNIDEADQTVDLLNNVIGRSIGTANQGANMNELANLVLDEFKNNGLYTATKNKDGNWVVSKTTLSSEKYNQLKEIFKGLNENGRTASEQKKVDAEAQKSLEELQQTWGTMK